jgi:hypothetical protein
LRIYVVNNNRLDHALRASVWVGGTNWALFGNWDHARVFGGVTVYGGGGGEDDVVDIVLLHAAEEGNSSTNIDTVVFERYLGGLANGLAQESVCAKDWNYWVYTLRAAK